MAEAGQQQQEGLIVRPTMTRAAAGKSSAGLAAGDKQQKWIEYHCGVGP